MSISKAKSMAKKGKGNGTGLGKVGKSLVVKTIRTEKNENYWREKLFGKVIRQEIEPITKVRVNVREWICPQNFANSLVNRATFDNHKGNKLGRFQRAITRDITTGVIMDLRENGRKRSWDFVIFGPKGITKSTLAHKLFLIGKQIFEESGRELTGPDWAGNIAQALAIYATCPDRHFVITDENSSITGKGSGLTAKDWANILMSIGSRQVSTVICCPEPADLPGCETQFMPIAIWCKGLDLLTASEQAGGELDYSECRVKVIVFARDKESNVSFKPIGYCIFDVSDALEYMAESGYEDWKRSNQEKLMATQGSEEAFTPHDHEMVEDYTSKIVAACHKHTPIWDGQNLRELETIMFDSYLMPPAKIKDLVIIHVRWHSEEFRKKELDPGIKTTMIYEQGVPFLQDRERHLVEMASEKKWMEKVPIYQRFMGLLALNKTIEEIARDEFNHDHSWGSKLLKSVDGEINRRVGADFEEYFTQQLQAKKKEDGMLYYAEVHGGFNDENCGKHGKKDVWATKDKILYVWSCKALNFRRTSLSLPIREIDPEIEFIRERAGDYAESHLYALINNAATGITEEKEIDYLLPPSRVLVKYDPD